MQIPESTGCSGRWVEKLQELCRGEDRARAHPARSAMLGMNTGVR